MLPRHFFGIPGVVINHGRIYRGIVVPGGHARQCVLLIDVNRSGYSGVGQFRDDRNVFVVGITSIAASTSTKSKVRGHSSASPRHRTHGRRGGPTGLGGNFHRRQFLDALRIHRFVVHVKLLMPDGGAATWGDDFGRLVIIGLRIVVGAPVIGADDAMGGAQRHTHLVRGTQEPMDVGDTGGSVSLSAGAYRRVDGRMNGIASPVFFGGCRFGSSTIGGCRGDGTEGIGRSKVKLSFGIFFGCSRRITGMATCTCICSVTTRTC